MILELPQSKVKQALDVLSLKTSIFILSGVYQTKKMLLKCLADSFTALIAVSHLEIKLHAGGVSSSKKMPIEFSGICL